jgi:sigma-B regulation protein RsbU (phosphoserine phosphatase)
VKKKILLVDDEQMQLMLLHKLLESSGFLVSKAESVLLAMDFLAKEPVDLIISDLEMDQLDGFEFREILLNNEKLKHIPFLFLTAHNEQMLIQRGLSLKAIDYIPKNIPKEQLIAKINNILATVDNQQQSSISELKLVADKLNLRNVPKNNYQLESFKIDIFHKSFQNHPGGDFIDVIKINYRYTFIVLGDVMGKKWGAWFFSFTFLSYIRSAIRICVFDGNLSVSSIMQKINQVIHFDDFLDDIYSTLSLILIDNEDNIITYSGASDLPILRFNHLTKTIEKHKSKGLLLGFFEEGNFNEQIIPLEKGDILYLLTDGAIDFESNGVKKTDINFFINQLENLNKEDKDFPEITTRIFNKEKYQVDDCSLIQILRS